MVASIHENQQRGGLKRTTSARVGASGLTALAWAAFALMPWYWLDFSRGVDWSGFPFGQAGTGLALALSGTWWLLPLLLPLGLAAYAALPRNDVQTRAKLLVASGLLGLALTLGQGFGVGLRGWNAEWLTALFGAPGPKQDGMGLGGVTLLAAFLFILCRGLAARGWCRGDVFVVTSIGTVIGLILLFVFYPVSKILVSAVQDNAGGFAPSEFVSKFTDRSIWGLDCLGGQLRCGVAWNTLFLGVLVGFGSTALGLAFALIATRTGFRAKGALRVLSVLPIITPPFVIGLALILMFGRSGVVSQFLSTWLGIPPSRWIYGLPGVLIAQLLAFTPIAFLVLVGVVQGISPSLEEASQTLRASNWTTFRTITLPLIRPGLANAFLLGFVESLADFGNPLVLGGNFEVLSTKIFFAVVGAATTRDAPPCCASCCSASRSRRSGAASVARQEGLHDRGRQGRFRPAAAAAQARGLGVLRHRAALGAVHLGDLRHHPGRRLRRRRWAATTRPPSSTTSPRSESRTAPRGLLRRRRVGLASCDHARSRRWPRR